MSKKPRSFSIDEELADTLSERDDLNPSGAVNTFLREYLSGGRGAEAAIEVRISQLDEEIAELEKDLERKCRERERLEDRIRDRQDDRDETIDEFVNWIQSGTFQRDNLTPDNDAVIKQASHAALDPERFVEEVRERL